MFIPDSTTQVAFKDSIKISLTLLFDSWFTDRKRADTGLEFQVDEDSAQHVSSPNYLTLTHESLARKAVPNKANNIANFNNDDVGIYSVEIDGQRYHKNSVNVNYAEND